ncbi:Crp/Fnr family transcriptional regulator [Neolewinella persica]|uniref:Crp/Fnr family transcriptional regulator n=1 Tax=Neolewinella persica TaxID=70998 RepID=UPI000375E003|nr:Crp/Fnr family transcriptional regulator [Neolewinella persica]
MITPLTDFIKKYIHLTDQDISEIEARAVYKSFSKGDFMLKVDEVAKELCFIFSGVLRVYYVDKSGNEVTYMFIKEGDLFTETTSFYNESPSICSIKAETDTEVVIFPKPAWRELRTLVKDWDFAMKRLSQDQLMRKLRFQRLMIDQDATTAYKVLLDKEPTIALRVPAHHLASYMGITRHSLSRIRKKIASENKS